MKSFNLRRLFVRYPLSLWYYVKPSHFSIVYILQVSNWYFRFKWLKVSGFLKTSSMIRPLLNCFLMDLIHFGNSYVEIIYLPCCDRKEYMREQKLCEVDFLCPKIWMKEHMKRWGKGTIKGVQQVERITSLESLHRHRIYYVYGENT